MDNKEQCRAEFEAWAAREGYAIEGEYPYPVDLMHKAWQEAWHRHAVAELAAIAKAATSPAPAVVQMTDEQIAEISKAYGILWHVMATLDAPAQVDVLRVHPLEGAKQARKILFEILTHQQRGEGITAAMSILSASGVQR
jgi:hypothetical protein